MDEVYALSHTLCNARLKRNSQDEGGILTVASENKSKLFFPRIKVDRVLNFSPPMRLDAHSVMPTADCH